MCLGFPKWKGVFASPQLLSQLLGNSLHSDTIKNPRLEIVDDITTFIGALPQRHGI